MRMGLKKYMTFMSTALPVLTILVLSAVIVLGHDTRPVHAHSMPAHEMNTDCLTSRATDADTENCFAHCLELARKRHHDSLVIRTQDCSVNDALADTGDIDPVLLPLSLMQTGSTYPPKNFHTALLTVQKRE